MRIQALSNPCEMEITDPNVLTLRFTGLRAGWEQWFLLTSDLHDDSALSDRGLMRRHLDEAVENDALILNWGDNYDVMQMPMDKRQSKSEMRTEDLATAYLDKLVSNSAKRLAPYANRWPVMGLGNHETSVLAKHGTNLTDRLAAAMREAGGITQGMGYHGWVRFLFERKAHRSSMTMYFHHGSGGAAPMTHGTLDTRRMASWTDADVICAGHTHTNYVLSITRRGLSAQGKQIKSMVDFVRTPGYKAEGGWEIEKNHPPKPRGAVWMRLSLDQAGNVKRHYMADLEA
jgi:hypothetical protein